MALWTLLAQVAPLPRFDYSINIVEAALIPFAIWGLRLLVTTRDDFRDLKRTVGHNGDDGTPKTGICLEIEKHRKALQDAGWYERRKTERTH